MKVVTVCLLLSLFPKRLALRIMKAKSNFNIIRKNLLAKPNKTCIFSLMLLEQTTAAIKLIQGAVFLSYQLTKQTQCKDLTSTHLRLTFTRQKLFTLFVSSIWRDLWLSLLYKN